MVQRMLDGIKLQVISILIPLAVDYIQNNLMGDWLGAVQHMSIKIAQQFPPRSWKTRSLQSAAHWVYQGRDPRPEEVAEEVVEAKEAEAEMVEAEGVAEAKAVVVKRHTSTA